MNNKLERIGEIDYNTNGSKMTIVEYIEYSNIIVEFNNGYKIKSSYKHFKEGKIKSLYDKSVFGVGYIGEGNYKTRINTGGKEHTIQYNYWKCMLQRCYDEKYIKKHNTYEKCICCEEWHNFQNFAKWFDNNYYEVNNEIMNLDKDILYKGNKEYNPNNCIFVPQRINTLFTKCDKSRGQYPIGVTFHKYMNTYVARCNIFVENKSKLKHIGYYNTPEDAFNEGYKPFKENYIKSIADEYKNQIPKELYNALYRYKVEITD